MSECLFCKIAEGTIPSTTIYEDDNFRVFLDVFPGTKGHTLIIPKKHVENIFELDEETAAKLFALATKVARAMKKQFNFQGMNVLQNNGKVAGQTVFHFHLHLIPRYEEDGVKIKWNSSEANTEELKELRDTIQAGL